MIGRRMTDLLCLSLLGALAGSARRDGGGVADYRPVPGWAKLPAGLTLGPVSAVATDAADRVFVCHRGPRPVLVFEADGTFLRSWGDDALKTPHGLRIDSAGHVWL